MHSIVSALAPDIFYGDGANRAVAASIVVAAGTHPTGFFREHFGIMVFAWCDAVNHYGYLDVDAETLYRKLMGHDRATVQAAPFPPLKPSS